MIISNSWFSHLARAFAISLCTALLLNFVSCSDSSTSQDPKVKIILDANGGSFSETTETTQTLLIKKNQASKLPKADELNLSCSNHNFKGWAKSQQGTVEFNDGTNITSSTDLTLYAQWEAVNSTYTVKHLLQNLQDDSYTEDEDSTEQKSGKSGTKTDANAKTYEGFTAKSFAQATIQADGSTVVEIYYDRKTYTLSYSSTNGEPPASKTVRYGYVLTAADLPDLTQTNYSFKGWFFDGASIAAGYTVKKAITLTALWDEIIATYTVKHLLQNLQDYSYTEDSTEQKSGKSGTKTDAAAKSYEGFTARTFAQATIQADGTTLVEIYYDRKTYTVSYSSTYGEPPVSKTVKYGYVLTAADLPDLTQTNYSFKGWLFDGVPITAGYTVKTDITLTAQWDIVIATYTVKHLLQNLQDDGYTEEETEQKSGKSGTQTAAAARTYEGFTAKSFTQKTIQADGSTVIEICYDRITYTISYSSTYGEPPANKPVKYGYVLTAADLPNLTQTNYSFKGWRLDGASIETGYTVKTDITITALWNEIIATYKVKHLLQNLQDDEYTEDSAEQKSGKAGTQTAAAAKTYEGYTAKSFAQATIQADGSTVIQIKYDRNTYTLSYSSTYGDKPQAKTVKYGYVLTAADLPDLTQTNYSFKGWVYENTTIEAGYIVKKAITLTAQWDEIIATYTVKHLLQNLQNDSYTEKAREQKSGKSGTKTAATAKNYTGFTAKSFTQATIQADGSTVVKIYYNRKTYTVSYSSEYVEPHVELPASKTVKYEYVLTAADLPDLTKTSYTFKFKGWRLDGASIAAGYTVKKNITLTAQWKALPSIKNFSTFIAALTEDSTIVLTGELTNSDLKTLQTEIRKSTYNVNLDLSQTIGLTMIPERTFINCTKLSGISIPDTVTTIREFAFTNCTSLSSVIIPDSVTSIEDSAFSDCTVLSSVTIPDSVTSISQFTFASCSSLSSVTIPDSVTSIGNHAFCSCTSLSSVTIPDSVTMIDRNAFDGCTSLSSVTIPDSVKYIEEYTFHNCTSLSSVTIPDSVIIINRCAFDGCTSLSSVTMGNSVINIREYAFSDCSSLSSITIPDSVTMIDRGAFGGCTSLSSVTIPDSVTSIGDQAFYNCTSLTTITVDSNNRYYSSIDGVLFNKDATTLITYPAGRQSVAYTIPNSVISIGNNAFDGCTSLSSVTIPNSVTSIGNNAFDGCTSLTTITVDSNNANYYSIDGVLFNKDATAMITYPAGKQSAAYSIPDSVTSIGGYAFYGCTFLSSISIPDSVTSIGSSAFAGCTSLSSVTIPESVTWIRDFAFSSCSSLSSVTIPKSVTSIGYRAFYWCSKLTSISFIDTTTWYRTDNSTNCNNKTGGTLIDVSAPAANAVSFTDTYTSYYWYKL